MRKEIDFLQDLLRYMKSVPMAITKASWCKAVRFIEMRIKEITK